MGAVRIGIIGWNYPEWKGLVYPPKAKASDLLRHYAQRWPIVEAASSYYGMPKADAVKAWADATPAGFRMSLKVPDWLLKTTGDDLSRALTTFLGRLEPLQASGKLGTLVAQFQPSFAYAKGHDRLRAFVEALPRAYRWAVELRHASWWRDETYELLSGAGVTLVWSELGKLRTPEVVTSDAVYVRLFGDRELEPPYDRKRRDAEPLLRSWAERIEEAAPRVERVDVLVSKFLEGYAPASAATLGEMLHLERLPGPEPSAFGLNW